MMPLTALYDEYINRPKLTEQKNPFEIFKKLHNKSSSAMRSLNKLAN